MIVAIGKRLGPYEITARLGEGGMGEVYRATDSDLKREVAIKVLPAAFTADPDRLARFEREAQLLAQLHHPNIASIFGLEKSGGTRALVMELVEGPTLGEKIAQGKLTLDETVAIARQIAEALEAAHEKGIVHRDLKPANIKLTPEGNVKVLDFGLAKALDPVASSSSPAASPTLMHSPTLTAAGTQLGVILGTAAYMAPEQARGAAVDKRADIWAFGVVLYEMLAGRSLFAAETVTDTLAGVLKTELDFGALPAETPAELRRLLRRCLERNPKNRLHDIADARIALSEIAAGAVDSTAKPAPPAGRDRLVFAAIAGALVLGVAGYFVGKRGAAPAPKTASSLPTAFVQVTDAPGVESAPTLSPDGKDVVFTRYVDGRSEILIQRVGARTSTVLTAGSGTANKEPAFAPDGERIAFRSEREGGGIFLMDTSGESVRRLTDFGFHPTWSPDGREVAVAHGGFIFPTDRAGATRGMTAIDVASGARRAISREADVMQPRWSPHGQRIAFWGLKSSSGQRDIYTVAADGSEADSPGVALTDDAALDWGPEWSPDGRYLYFSSQRGGTVNLWRAPIDEATGVSTGPLEPVTTPSLWAGYLSFSRDGKRLAYASLDWRTTLWRAELDAERGRVGARSALLEGTLPIRDHALSPDGELVAFNRITTQVDLFVARTDGTQSRRLTDDAARDRAPVWSPDGARLLFYTDRNGKYEVWSIRPDGSDARQVSDSTEGTANFPNWSPDGRRVAFSRIPGGGRIIDLSGPLPAAGEEVAPLGDGNATFWPTSWSPDGRTLAGNMVLETGQIAGIATYDLASRRYERWTRGMTEGWRFLVWLGDSRRLVMRDLRGIWLFDPAAGEPVRLVAVGGYSIGRSVGVSADDRWLTWSETGTEGDVWVAEFGGVR